MEKQVSEGSLHKWFKGSKSKDGKGGWVNVVTGGTCASDEPGEGTPKCVSSAKRASMTKAERLSAARRKKKADPGQQQKSGAAKPTYVSTDKPKKKKMKESYTRSLTPLTEKAKKCWPGYEKKGTKKMFGKTYNNCVKKEEVEIVDEAMSSYDRNRKAAAKRAAERNRLRRAGKMGGRMENETYRNEAGTTMHHKGYKVEEVEMEAYSANPAQQAAIAIAKKKKKEDDMVAKKKKQSMYASYQPEDEMVDEGVKEVVQGAVEGGKKIIKKGKEFVGAGIQNLKKQFDNIDDPVKGTSKIIQMNGQEPEGETIEEADKKGKGSGTKDACYHKVKSRYSVWPSAYASGALVKCRKVGAANWGNSSKKEAFSDWKSEFIWEDGDSSKKLEEKIKSGVKGDGFLGPTVGGLGIPNPIRITKDVVDTYNRSQQKNVNAINKELPGSAKMGKFKEFNPTVSTATTKLLGIKNSYEYEKSNWRSDLDEDWQKTNRQDKTDGMSQKAVNAYKRENPGSKLKTAVTKKPSSLKRGSKDAKRRKSFCSRMKGMKKRLTSAKTARDPNSRINKALRRWNC